MSKSYRIAELSLGSSAWNALYDFDFRSHRFEVQRFGANHSTEALKEMIKNMGSQVDAIAISSLIGEIRFRDRSYVHRDYLDVMSTPSNLPLCDGERLRELSHVNGLTHLINQGDLRPEEGIYFPSGLMFLECIQVLKERHLRDMYFGDAYAITGLPKLMQSDSRLIHLARPALNLANFRSLKGMAPRSRPLHSIMLRSLKDVRYVMADPGVLLLMGEDLKFIQGRDVIVPFLQPGMAAQIQNYQPNSIISLFPECFNQLSPYVTHSVMDAALRLSLNRPASLAIEDWQEILQTETAVTQATKRYVLGSRPSTQARISTRVRRYKNHAQGRRSPDFAFVVHSLSFDYLYKVAPLRVLQYAPPSWADSVESSVAKLPGIVYGHARGIVSQKTGRETTGIIYGLFATPKVMRRESPVATYAKIDRLCHHAAQQGVKLMGLGAYTKVIGDAGATINRNSPIPVTTGNSLSVSATLWGLHEVVKKMGLLRTNSETGKVMGTATIVGATGSIGKVSAKLLSMVFDRVCLVAPRWDRLVDLKAELEKFSPRCEVILALNANEVAPMTDVLVTATSAYDQKVVEVERLKPGCVVCDCSRPLDFTLQDAIKRPDILIMESGEVVLPGNGRQLDCDLGLPGNSVYACLGETAVLAMEGLIEPFTLGRDIEWSKVKRIYQLAREHGVKLSGTRGLNGFITDKEIQLTRALAIERGAARPSSGSIRL